MLGIEMDEMKKFPVTVEDANIFLKTNDTFEKFLLKLEENHLDIDSLLIKIRVESFRGKKYIEKNDTEYRIMEFPLSENLEPGEIDQDFTLKSKNFQLCKLCRIHAVDSIPFPSELTTQCPENNQRFSNLSTPIISTKNEFVESKEDAQFKETCPNLFSNFRNVQNDASLMIENEMNDENTSNLELENILNEAISMNLESESILNDISILNLETDTILNDFAISNPEDISNEATDLNNGVSIPIPEVLKPVFEKSESVNGKLKTILDTELENQCTKIENLDITKPLDSEIAKGAKKFVENSLKGKKSNLKSKKKRSSKTEFHKSKKQRKETIVSFGNEIKDSKCFINANVNSERFTCQKCKMDLSTENQLRNHCQNNCLPEKAAGLQLEETSNFNSEGELMCEICKAVFIKKERFNFHLELHKNGDFDSLKCHDCEKVFETETVLWNHFQIEHKRFFCVDCKRIFRRRASLEFHLKTSGHSSTDGNLKEEQIKLTDSSNQPMMNCAKCGARYRRQERYEFHAKRHELGQIDVFICTKCDKEFMNENVLWDHYLYTHRKIRSFTCKTCEKVFQKRISLRNHQLKHKHKGAKTNGLKSKNKISSSPVDRKQKSLNCVMCGELVSNSSPDFLKDSVTCVKCETPGLSLQVKPNGVNSISRREYHCNLCSKHFSSKDRLEYHIMRHSENMEECICSTCGKKLSTEQALFEHHLFVHKGARPHICELCGKSFQFRTRLKDHLRSHSGERPFVCEVCHQSFMTKNSLRSHSKTHINDKKFPCQLCSKLFRRQQDLNEHLERHWKTDKSLNLSRFFHCENCSESFPTIRVLKAHLKEHHGIENEDLTELQPWFKCEHCPETFKHQMSLKSHNEKVHKGRSKRIYRCEKCDLIYKTARLLASHMSNNHGGEKRFKCSQCGKKYNQSKSLQNHILIHTGEKPFSCQICEMRFRTKESRNHHQRKHTGEKPFKCPGCEETFATAGQRRGHRKKSHEDGDEQPCPECGKICLGERGVRSHLSVHADEKRKMQVD